MSATSAQSRSGRSFSTSPIVFFALLLKRESSILRVRFIVVLPRVSETCGSRVSFDSVFGVDTWVVFPVVRVVMSHGPLEEYVGQQDQTPGLPVGDLRETEYFGHDPVP